jgi:hypothetical protein
MYHHNYSQIISSHFFLEIERIFLLSDGPIKGVYFVFFLKMSLPKREILAMLGLGAIFVNASFVFLASISFTN